MKKYFFVYLLFLLFVPGVSFAAPVILAVPFTPQAPEGVWIEPWNNACEETSMVMVESYYRGTWNLSVDKSKKEIQNMLIQKEALFGVSKDESAETMVRLMGEVYKRQAELVKNISVEKIKHEIDGGYPVIIAFDARKVTNSNFISPKPTYHVAVIIGYDNETQQFILNEPGTSEGKQFRYGYTELLEANKKYMVRDTGEVRGNEAVFTSSLKVDATSKGLFVKFFDFFKTIF